MIESSIQRSWTLSKAQVAAILDDVTYKPAENKSGLLPIEMRFMDFGETGEAGNYEKISMTKTNARIAQWCQEAYDLLDPEKADLDSHLERLDAAFSTLVTCCFQVHKKKLSRDEIVDKTCAFLARLPSYPPELQFDYESKNGQARLINPWPAQYLCTSSTDEAQSEEPQDGYKWASLRVLSRPSTSVIRIALYLTMDQSIAFALTSDYSDTIVRLLDAVTELYRSSTTEAAAQAWFVVQAFLWAAWQQTVMLQFGYDCARVLRIGYQFERHNYLISRLTPLAMPGRAVVERSRPSYMCKWAFELLRSDLSSVTQDFRKFFKTFEIHFGGRAARCNLVGGQGRQRVCDGKAPGNCQRFESEGVQIQSAHDVKCPGPTCSFLTWDEQSYKDITGARAVCPEKTDDKLIRYRPVTSETMAVSHVWSHGQGGRPETGFNICLHRRYTELARTLGCTSYWMDSPCVPTDSELRTEALGQINDNFSNSKVTLLVDRDIMEIDIHPLTLQAQEAILATLVVCDWNVRAWTLLEGLRGRVRLHLLCKDNRIISLKDVISSVVLQSDLSLISPCLAIQYYTPTHPEDAQFVPEEVVTKEQATCLLNHRHATKDRDVTMIWSLVCGSNKIVKTAEGFWKATVGQPVATGFLVSSAPRIKSQGLSWAPARPNLLPPTAGTPNEKPYPAYDGQNSVSGIITTEGLQAEWLVCPIRRSRALGMWFSLYTYADAENRLQAYYRIWNEGANSKMDMKSLFKLRSVIAPLFKKHRWVALLQPALRHRTSTGPVSPPRPFPYQGEFQGPLLVVVTSDDEEKWEWQFVHEWDTNYQLPEFSIKEILIV
ncbi:HET domain protein [Aspergillus clavatus NRRL 1]|uniref:HET domain protein n=1 Tax=Aspergillus clavatus (strain ATCC 1007 / CBS 513.65 / DSM 816 / NCTC 3887 / NRRL 1 / QM 1276 / 107) TaxID=344612 RepID=A1C834_ASPCL|nr:HET domain protein [Aspergillus clavatus NRRL 1]EAW14555.1 HET domain protein [Aspergillus clavatus NRRL 1]